MVRAKFKVESVTSAMSSIYRNGVMVREELKTVKMRPVMGDSEENKAFFAATPSGCLELGCVKGAAAEAFQLDGEYYVDFTPADQVQNRPPAPAPVAPAPPPVEPDHGE